MKRLSILILLTLLFSACGNKFIYFQMKKDSQNSYDNIQVVNPPDIRSHVVEEGDVLQIRLFSDDEKMINLFNQNVLDEKNSISGYQVKNNGNIFLPFIGDLAVKGKTLDQAEQLIKDSLSVYVSAPNLALDLTAFQVIVLGAVRAPGPVLVRTDKASIIDVIAFAGDLSDYGNPRNIKVVRDVDGKKMNRFLDLSDVDVFKDPYFYIGSNDIIYVETLKRRFVQENLTVLSLVSTMLNVVALIALRF